MEPKRKLMDSINKTLSSDIFYMLNNLNLRHNNGSKDDKNYKSVVANMCKPTLESWYDELYQMMLLAFLEIDQQDRASKVKDLKNKIENAT